MRASRQPLSCARRRSRAFCPQRMPAPTAARSLYPAGCAVPPRCLLRMAGAQLCDLPWRHPAGHHLGVTHRRNSMGIHRRTGFETSVPTVLERRQGDFFHSSAPIPKNFHIFNKKCEKSVCIYKKMGYNRKEYSPPSTALRREPT